MNFDPSRYIDFDWKTPTQDFLLFLQQEYPDLQFLNSDEFEELIDELSNEFVEESLEVLANYLIKFNHQLWSINFHSDTYYLSVVPSEKSAEFKKFWDDDYDEQDSEMEIKPDLELIEAINIILDGKSINEKKYDWVEEEFIHSEYGGLTTLGLNSHLENIYYEDESGKRFQNLYDFSSWPPVEVLQNSPGNWTPFYQKNSRNLWKHDLSNPEVYGQDKFQFADVAQFNPWKSIPIGSKDISYNNYYFESVALEDGILHVVEKQDERKRIIFQLIKISNDKNEVWFESHLAIKLFPLYDGHQCLVVNGTIQYAVLNGPSTIKDFRDFPIKASDKSEFFVVGDEEIIYFSEQKHKNPYLPTKKIILQMNRIDVNSGLHKTTALEGFGSKLGFKDDKGFKIQVCSFEGNLKVYQGHEDWWILNYSSNLFGGKDIAWMWNSVSEEVIRISSKDFPRQSPSILYIEALQRYVANDSGVLSLLYDFQDLYDAKTKEKLVWLEGRFS